VREYRYRYLHPDSLPNMIAKWDGETPPTHTMTKHVEFKVFSDDFFKGRDIADRLYEIWKRENGYSSSRNTYNPFNNRST